MERDSSALTIRKEEKPKLKERLKNWYIKHIANNGKNIERVHDMKINVENTAGGVVLSAFFPQLLPVVPAIQKASKAVKKFEYKVVQGAIHKGLGIDDSEINRKPVAEELQSIDDNTISNAVNAVGDFVIERTGGRGR